MNNISFRTGTVTLPVNNLYPLFPRKLTGHLCTTYRKIVSSIKEIGLVEPLVVVEKEGRYYIKDGVLRWTALKELKIESVECLIGTDDDVYTYNKRVNPLTVSETHTMINKAIQEGVSLDRIAATLNVKKEWVRKMDSMLIGVAPSVIGLLRQHNVSRLTCEELKKVSYHRQIEIVELLNAANDFSRRYTRTLVLSTPEDQWSKAHPTKTVGSEAQRKELTGKLYQMEDEFKRATSSYRDNVFDLVKFTGYVRKVIADLAVRAFLEQNYPDIQLFFEKVINDHELDV